MNTTGGDARPTRHGLAGHLRALREATRPKVSQTTAARAIEASQNKISRAESGRWVLTPDEVRTLAQLYGASAAERRQLVEWATALAPGEVDARQMLRRGGGTAAFQARVRQLEEGAQVVRAFQPGLVLGQLQTRAYAEVVFGGAGPAVDERVQRNRMLLEDDSRRWVLVQPIGALLWNFAGNQIMAEQMDALIEASRLPHIDLRIVTADRPAPIIATHGFHLYDRKAVLVGILTGTTLTTEAHDVETYAAHHDRLVAAAVGDDQARAAIAQAAEHYQDSRRD